MNYPDEQPGGAELWAGLPERPDGIHVKGPGSTVSSGPSMQSDWSRDPPPNFKREEKSCGSRDSGVPPSESATSASVVWEQCDVCFDTSVKICLTCMASYCVSHVKDHYRSPDLQTHQLENFQHQGVCDQHHKQHEFYCRTDQSAICSHCLLHNHKEHDVIEKIPQEAQSKREGVPPPGLIQFTSVQSNSVTLRWSPPEGATEPLSYRVTRTRGQELRSFTVAGLGMKVTNLTPGETYHFAVASLSADGYQGPSVKGTVRTEVPSPEDLSVDLRSLTASLKWTRPAGVDQVSYLLELFRDQEHINTISTDAHQYTFTGLQGGTDYSIRVSTVLSNNRQSKPTCKSFATDTFSVTDCTNSDFTLIRKQDNRRIYRLNMTTESEGHFYKYSFGTTPLTGENKTILLVGATGAGKSTLINGMINYILGVKWEDHNRFELIAKETVTSQAHSQTSNITAYRINHRDGYQVPYSVTVIDTPGFGETQGIKRDKAITKSISDFFSMSDGVASIDAVGFVVQSALPRQTVTQRYIFDSILSIFGKDIAENIMILITFADGQAPPALEAITAANVPCARQQHCPLYFKFNNSALFAGGSSDGFDEMFWKMGINSMKRFFDNLQHMPSKSLQLTKEVLEERKNLEATVEGLLPKITMGLMKLDEVTKTIEILESKQSLAEACRNFEYDVETPVVTKEDLTGKGIYVTNCTACDFTCHKSCPYANDSDKQNCCAIKGENCTVCPGKCHWTQHANMPYRFVYSMKKEKKTYANLLENYLEAVRQCLSLNEVLDNLGDEYSVIQKDVLDFIGQLTKSQKRLEEIALRPSLLSVCDYIDLMIKSEEQRCEPGYMERISELYEIRKGAQIMEKVSQGEKLLPNETQVLGRWEKAKKHMHEIYKGAWFKRRSKRRESENLCP